MSSSAREIMRRYNGSLSIALILLTAFSLCAQAPRTPDCLGPSMGLFAALDIRENRPCLHTRDGVKKAKLCDANGHELVMGKDMALQSIVEYQDHLLDLEPVKKDPEISWILGRVSGQDWLDAAALIIAGLPGPKAPPSSEQRFQQNLLLFQVQMYNDQIPGQGFGEQSFYDNAVVPGLELYAVKKWGAQWRMTPADLAKLCGGPGEAPAPDLDTVVRAMVRNKPPASP